MRIAMGGIAIESCTFSPLPSRLEDFTILRGEEMLSRYPFLEKYSSRASFVPLQYARSIPGGSVVPEAYAHMKQGFLDMLRQEGPFDGVYLDLHGAMHVQGMDDAEGDWIMSVRELVGPDCLISASFDLHGNISQREVEALDLLTAYRTAPHVDVLETREKAIRMLVECLEQGLRPERVWIPVPVLLPGEKTSTEWAPGDRLYAALAESDTAPGLLDISMLVGYAWADEPRASATVIATGMDRAVLEREARRMAQLYWDAREEFQFGVPAGSMEDCVVWSISADESCVFISDSGDNPTAGGVGDSTVALSALLLTSLPPALVVGIADAQVVKICMMSRVGAYLYLEIGGKLDKQTSRPVTTKAQILHIAPSENSEVVLDVRGVHVIVSEKRRPYHTIGDIKRLGVDPLAYKFVVIKIGYLEPDLKRAAPKAFLALTPGAVDQAITRLPFKRINRPMFPFDQDFEPWVSG